MSSDLSVLTPEKLPTHVACIMDGNGRWAAQQGLLRFRGHRAGTEAVRTTIKACIEFGIPWLTLYAFSSENWNRPRMEVETLMSLLHEFLKKEIAEMDSQGVKLHAIGDISRLPRRTQDLLKSCIERTQGNSTLNLVLALSYGARAEILRAVQNIAQEVQSGAIKIEDISEDLFSNRLDTAGMPDPDLVIRTSGENRISNFLLWQIKYSEIYITPTLWPDFSRNDFILALQDYAKRQRRYGGL
jgi:undecaprenyl diphosphate synthase